METPKDDSGFHSLLQDKNEIVNTEKKSKVGAYGVDVGTLINPLLWDTRPL